MCFLILHGLPASGKSTFVRQNNLQEFTICPDNIRLQCGNATVTVGNHADLLQTNNSVVFDIARSLVTERLKRRLFTVLDATCLTVKELRPWVSLARDYGVLPIVVDFSSVPYEECLERDRKRYLYSLPGVFAVGPTEMERLRNKLDSGRDEFERYISKGSIWRISGVRPDAFAQIEKALVERCSRAIKYYKAVHFIGDIHGCYTALKGLFSQWGYDLNDLPQDRLFVFLGDFLDRGIENVDVLKCIHSLSAQPNVLLVEGNHEKHWRAHLRGDSVSDAFKNTLKECDRVLDPKTVRQYMKDILQKCKPVFYLMDDSHRCIQVCHGGVPSFIGPQASVFNYPCDDFIRGIGRYSDAPTVASTFDARASLNCFQVFGHRNVDCGPIKFSDRCFNLCDQVEHGGSLRGLVYDPWAFNFKEYKSKNSVFRPSRFTVTDEDD